MSLYSTHLNPYQVNVTMDNNASVPVMSSVVRPTVPSVLHPRRKLSGFCGEYLNSTRIDEDHGVLGNECFLNGLSFVPNIVFVLIAVPVLISWNKSIFASMHVKTWVRFPHHTFRWIVFFFLILLNALEFVAGFLSDQLLYGTHLHLYIPHMASVAGTLVAVVYYHSVEMWNSPRFLLLLIPYWLALTVIEIMKTINLNLMKVPLIYMRPHFTRVSILVYILILLVELDVLRQLRYAFFKKRRMLKPPESLAETDYVQSAVSLPSKATYFWIRSLVDQANKSPLELKDLGQLPESERSSFNYSRLVAAIEEERDKQMTDEQVASTLWKCYWVKGQSMMVLAGLFMLAGSFFHLSNPILLIYILQFVEVKAANPQLNVSLPKDGDMVEVKEFFSNGYVLTLFLFISSVLMNTFFQAGNYLVIREGVRLRGALQLLLYTKILALSMWNFSTRAVSIGQIIGHLSVDSNNMLFCACIVHFVWLLPLKMILAVGMLYGIIGWSALIGGATVVLLALLQYLMATQLSVVQRDISECADLRLKRCTEMLQNIKPLKLYAWEQVVSERAEEIRVRQLRVMLKAAVLKALTTFISEGSPIIVLILAFALYPYLETEPLTAQKVFPAILLFDIIGMPIQLLPLLSNFMVNARASTRKVAEFLGTAEIDSRRYHVQKPKFQNATFHGNDSGHSSQTANADDGRSGTRRGPLSSPDQQSIQSKLTRSFQYQAGATGSMELLPQLSVIHEDKNEVGGTTHEADARKEDRSCKRKGSKVKNKTKKKPLREMLSQPGSEDVESVGSDANHQPVVAVVQVPPPPDTATDPRGQDDPDAHSTASSARNSITRAPFGFVKGGSEDGHKRRSSEGDGKSVLSSTMPQYPVLLVPPLGGSGSSEDRDARHMMRPSSRRSSQQDLVGGRRTASVISASNSVGSGLDDDDLIDPNRDVGIAVDISDGCFTWEPESTEPQLNGINFRADAGRLTVIVGPFGSGKSSLIAAMLGEMTKLGGNVTWKPGLTVCYAGNVPWILNATVQENILFGRPMERKRYKRVLRACALQPDIDILPEKDLTEIGDRGISLSIGQRLRIGIARAIYSKADLVVLDDPFAALDLPIGSHIFEDGILHFCLVKRKRTVILVTHELHFLPFAHAIYRMEDGFLAYHGRLQDVKEGNPELFAVWQDAVRKARRENQSRAEREDTTNTERLVLLRKIRTLEFRREVVQSVLDEEKKGDSPKRVFLSGQTTHITIEEEHPGGEDVATETVADEDEDFDPTGNCSPPAKNSLMLKKKRLIMVDSGQGSVKYEGEKGRVVVMWSALLVYAKACCLPVALVLLVFHVMRASTLVASDFWLAKWCETGKKSLQTAAVVVQNETTVGPIPSATDVHYVRMYAGLTLTSLVLCAVIAFCTELSGLRAARLFYFRMLRNVIVAPMKFFDTNPISKIMSRFSGDVTVIDDKLATTIGHFVRTALLFLGTLTVNAVITPYFLAPAAVILIIFLWFQKHFRASYRELHKLDSVTKAPLLSHCVETLAGLRTIRAFRDESRYWEEMEKHINTNNCTHLWLNTANRWMGIRLDYLASLIVLSSAVASISVSVLGIVSSSMVGLGITYALLVSGYMNWAIRSIADVEVQVTAVQRAHEYSILPSENNGKNVLDGNAPPDWPSAGEIIFHGVSINYSGNSQAVARNINIHIRPGEKIGICGRPGSGKSSLILSLFGMVEITEGEIYIDGRVINDMPARLLRSRLAVLPQDCTLIAGTVRYNLDPEGVHSEDSLWEALDQVNLKDTVKYLSGQLDATVAENGDNFSISNKQLLCLARAVLKKSKVVIIDEVMSVLNANTEKILHNVLRTAFAERTVINLSHRASSLLDYDTVVVLDNGLIAEYDTPQNLLSTEGSIFAALLKRKIT